MHFEKTLRFKELLENRRNEASYVSGRIKVGSQEHNAALNKIYEVSKTAKSREEREAARVELEEHGFAVRPSVLPSGIITHGLTRTYVQKPYLTEDEKKLLEETYTEESKALEQELSLLEKQLLDKTSAFLNDIKSLQEERSDLIALTKEVERIPLDMEQHNFTTKFMYGSPIEDKRSVYSRIVTPLQLLRFSINQDSIDSSTKRLLEQWFISWEKQFR